MASSTHIVLLLAVCVAHTCWECRAMQSPAIAKKGLTQPKQSLQECLQTANIEVVTPGAQPDSEMPPYVRYTIGWPSVQLVDLLPSCCYCCVCVHFTDNPEYEKARRVS